MPKINEMLLKLESFNYDTSLHLNMGYYYIWLSGDASNLCRIVLSQGKYFYKHLPMGFINSPDIFTENQWLVPSTLIYTCKYIWPIDDDFFDWIDQFKKM